MTTNDAFEPDQYRPDQATSFGSVAEVYDRGRPGYPAEAIDWLLPEGAQHVVDLGAGTGKLTRLLLERVDRVTAVEPSEGMRKQLIRAVPTAQILPGSAERLPLDGESFDAVLAAQAWHWVDPARAVPEVARVLKPGGTLGLIWNMRDESVPWIRELSAIMGVESDSYRESESPRVGPPFGEVERRDFPWSNPVTPDDVVAMVASRSYVITLPAADREALYDRVRELLTTHPDLAGRSTIDVPYVARGSRAFLVS
ncbi:MAG: hypothetical protein JWP75_4184 [Frondihabitans sp.]|nr:hypothetical protein [Frondihabitans sp.]